MRETGQLVALAQGFADRVARAAEEGWSEKQVAWAEDYAAAAFRVAERDRARVPPQREQGRP